MVPTYTGRIIEWDIERRHGWVETDGQRIFLHWRDFTERRKRPEVGDRIRFTAGTGPNGKLCALKAAHLSDGARFGFLAFLFLASLLALPALAIARLPIDLRVVSGYAAAVSIAAYWAYARDKKKARAKEWRVSEATLHFLELIGGWPGAFVAQRRPRHKCSKLSYQAVFWAIVVTYQVVAFDFLQSWKFSNAVAKLLS